METVGVLIALVAVPLLLSVAAQAIIRVLAAAEDRRERRRPASATSAPIERVAADLRRLRAQLEARENRPGTTGKGMRMGALRVAYVEVLATACEQLDIRPPQTCPEWQTPLAEIYRVECELRQRGLDVRPIAYDHRFAA